MTHRLDSEDRFDRATRALDGLVLLMGNSMADSQLPMSPLTALLEMVTEEVKASWPRNSYVFPGNDDS